MRRTTKLALGAVGLAALTATLAATHNSRRADRVEYETVLSLDGVELRRYPAVVLAETTAPTTGQAFSRLFAYVSGENEGDREIEMTAPVRTRGTKISMTAPVRVGRASGEAAPVPADGGSPDEGFAGEGVTMAFYLPREYRPDTAPEPTNPAVELVAEPPRTLAVRGFSWWPTEGRLASHERRLLETLAARGVEPDGEPFYLGYDAPGTLPFLRTNEVAVAVKEG